MVSRGSPGALLGYGESKKGKKPLGAGDAARGGVPEAKRDAGRDAEGKEREAKGGEMREREGAIEKKKRKAKDARDDGAESRSKLKRERPVRAESQDTENAQTGRGADHQATVADADAPSKRKRRKRGEEPEKLKEDHKARKERHKAKRETMEIKGGDDPSKAREPHGRRRSRSGGSACGEEGREGARRGHREGRSKESDVEVQAARPKSRATPVAKEREREFREPMPTGDTDSEEEAAKGAPRAAEEKVHEQVPESVRSSPPHDAFTESAVGPMTFVTEATGSNGPVNVFLADSWSMSDPRKSAASPLHAGTSGEIPPHSRRTSDKEGKKLHRRKEKREDKPEATLQQPTTDQPHRPPADEVAAKTNVASDQESSEGSHKQRRRRRKRRSHSRDRRRKRQKMPVYPPDQWTIWPSGPYGAQWNAPAYWPGMRPPFAGWPHGPHGHVPPQSPVDGTGPPPLKHAGPPPTAPPPPQTVAAAPPQLPATTAWTPGPSTEARSENGDGSMAAVPEMAPSLASPPVPEEALPTLEVPPVPTATVEGQNPAPGVAQAPAEAAPPPVESASQLQVSAASDSEGSELAPAVEANSRDGVAAPAPEAVAPAADVAEQGSPVKDRAHTVEAVPVQEAPADLKPAAEGEAGGDAEESSDSSSSSTSSLSSSTSSSSDDSDDDDGEDPAVSGENGKMADNAVGDTAATVPAPSFTSREAAAHSNAVGASTTHDSKEVVEIVDEDSAAEDGPLEVAMRDPYLELEAADSMVLDPFVEEWPGSAKTVWYSPPWLDVDPTMARRVQGSGRPLPRYFTCMEAGEPSDASVAQKDRSSAGPATLQMPIWRCRTDWRTPATLELDHALQWHAQQLRSKESQMRSTARRTVIIDDSTDPCPNPAEPPAKAPDKLAADPLSIQLGPKAHQRRAIRLVPGPWQPPLPWDLPPGSGIDLSKYVGTERAARAASRQTSGQGQRPAAEQGSVATMLPQMLASSASSSASPAVPVPPANQTSAGPCGSAAPEATSAPGEPSRAYTAKLTELMTRLQTESTPSDVAVRDLWQQLAPQERILFSSEFPKFMHFVTEPTPPPPPAPPPTPPTPRPVPPHQAQAPLRPQQLLQLPFLPPGATPLMQAGAPSHLHHLAQESFPLPPPPPVNAHRPKAQPVQLPPAEHLRAGMPHGLPHGFPHSVPHGAPCALGSPGSMQPMAIDLSAPPCITTVHRPKAPPTQLPPVRPLPDGPRLMNHSTAGVGPVLGEKMANEFSMDSWASRLTFHGAVLRVDMRGMRFTDSQVARWCAWAPALFEPLVKLSQAPLANAVISFAENEIGDEGFGKIAELLTRCQVHCACLDVSRNCLTDKSVCALADLLSKFTSPFLEVRMEDNCIRGSHGITQIAQSLQGHDAYPIWRADVKQYVPILLKLSGNFIDDPAGIPQRLRETMGGLLPCLAGEPVFRDARRRFQCPTLQLPRFEQQRQEGATLGGSSPLLW